MITVDTRQIRKMVRDLEVFRSKAIPYAVKESLNRSAFLGRKIWQEEIRGAFTLRNRFTERSILVERAHGSNVNRMHAVLGSTASYMSTQETGGTERAKAHIKAIPGPGAAGQPAGSKRTRLVRAASRLTAIKVQKGKLTGVKGGAIRQNLVALAQAKRKGQKHVILARKGGGKGLYKVGGTKRKLRARLLYDLSKRSVHIPPSGTLKRTLKRIEPELQRIHGEALLQQLKRHRILGY